MTTLDKNVPALRFSGFSENWEKKELGELADITTGNKDTQNRIDDGKYPFFVRSQTVERINSFSFDGEAILTSGDGVGVGKNFHYINGKFDYHQRVYCLNNFKNQVSGKYIFFYFSEKFNKRVMRLSAKNSVDSVRRDMIVEMPINIPAFPEQQKIAVFLTAIDEKIQQLAKKKNSLEQYKKGVMQKIFNQEIRFKDDNGNDFADWEEKPLGEIGSFKNGLNKGKEDFGFGYPFINLMDVSGKPSITDDGFGLVNANKKEIESYNLLKGDILFIRSSVKKSGVGETSVVLEDIKDTVYSGFLIRFREFEETLDLLFKKYCFHASTFRNNLVSLSTTSANTNINQESLSDLTLSFPCIEEQKKIANFLSAIENKINSVNQQLEKTKEYKKGLLQQMFV